MAFISGEKEEYMAAEPSVASSSGYGAPVGLNFQFTKEEREREMEKVDGES